MRLLAAIVFLNLVGLFSTVTAQDKFSHDPYGDRRKTFDIKSKLVEWRAVEGKVYFLTAYWAWSNSDRKTPRPLKDWEWLEGKVAGFDKAGVIIRSYRPGTKLRSAEHGPPILVKNNPLEKKLALGDDVRCYAMKREPKSVAGYGRIHVYDYGVRLKPDPKNPYQAPEIPKPETDAAPEIAKK